MSCDRFRRTALSFVVAGIVVAAVSAANAATILWNLNTVGSWETATNWAGNVLPYPADTAHIAYGTCTIGDAGFTGATVTTLEMAQPSDNGGPSGTILQIGGTFNATTSELLGGPYYAGGYPTCFYTQSGGANITPSLQFGVDVATYNLNGGTLTAGSIAYNSSGANTFNLGGGMLQWSASTYCGAPMTLMAATNSTIDTQGFSPTMAGVLGGAGSLTVISSGAGTGTLNLSNANGFTGATTVSSGTLDLVNQKAVQNSTVALAGGSLVFNSSVSGHAFTVGGLSGSGNLLLQDNGSNAVALTVGGNNASTIYSGALSGSGSLIKVGTGTLTLSGPNNYTGTTTISAGFLSTAGSGSLPGFNVLNQVAVASGAGVGGYIGSGYWSEADLATLVSNANWTAGAALAIDTTPGSYTYVGVLTNGGPTASVSIGLTKVGANILTLNNADTYTGPTNLGGGMLSLGNAGAIGGSGPIKFLGGALQFTAADTLDYATVIKSSTSAIALDTNGQSVTFAGVIDSSNTGGLTKLGSGTLTLSGANTFTGTTTVSSGTLDLMNQNALQNSVFAPGLSALAFDAAVSGHAFTFGGLSGANGLTLQDSAMNPVALSVGNSNVTSTFSGGLSGAGSLTKIGSGTLTLSGANSYTGTTTIAAGILSLNNAAAIGGGGNITFTGGTLQYNYASSTQDYSSQIKNSTGPISIDTNGQYVTFAGNLDSSNTGGLTTAYVSNLNGTLVLTGSNSYTGTTTIAAGSLSLGSANALPAGGVLTFASTNAGYLQFSPACTSIANPVVSSYQIDFDTNGLSVTVASNMNSSNTQGLCEIGGGTLTLSGNCNYSDSSGNGTRVLRGTMQITGTLNTPSTILEVAPPSASVASTLLIGSSAVINVTTFYDGRSATSTVPGIVVQSGGTVTTTSAMVLGAFGSTGTYTQNAGLLTVNNGSYFFIGGQNGVDSGGGTGTYYLNGGSINADNVTLGSTGTGTFNQAGGVFTATTGNFNIAGDAANQKGTYNLSAGTLNVGNGFTGEGQADGDLCIGNQTGATATFIQTGGSVDATQTGCGGVWLGGNYGGRNGTGGTGTYTISGGTLICRGLSVGDDATGTFTQNGGVVTTTNVSTITADGWSFGQVQIGADASGGIGVYNLNAGTLNVAANAQNGLVIGHNTYSGGSFNGGGTGTFNLAGGMANLNGVNISGSGTFNFSGGTVMNAGTVSTAINLQSGGTGAIFSESTGSTTVVTGILSGNGGLTQAGPGQLNLKGANSYNGLTTVSAGVLDLFGTSSTVAWNPVLTLGGADILGGELVFDYSGGAADPDSTIAGLLGGKIYTTVAGDTLSLVDNPTTHQVTVSLAAALLPGDANGDGNVNGTDLNIVLSNYGMTSGATWAMGDFNGDGAVDGTDLNIVLSNYGASSHNTAAVPEPSTLLLAVAGLVGLLAFAWRKNK